MDSTPQYTPHSVFSFHGLRKLDALRFGYLLLRNGRWSNRQLVPPDYMALISRPSPFNPHSPFSLQFEVNADGHVAGAPRDTFFKSGAGGFGLCIVPSLDMVIYKMSSLNGKPMIRRPRVCHLPTSRSRARRLEAPPVQPVCRWSRRRRPGCTQNPGDGLSLCGRITHTRVNPVSGACQTLIRAAK